MVSDLLRTTGHDLENSVDELSAGLNLIENVYHQRQKISTSCKMFKDLFKEVRERSIQALGFAKMLQKELGIAAQYDVNTSYEKLFQLLNESRHKLVGYNFSKKIFKNWNIDRRKNVCSSCYMNQHTQ